MKRIHLWNSIRRIHSGRLGTFLLNFYATALGVFLSLLMASWMEQKKQDREITQSLTFVHEEMCANLKMSQWLYKQIRLEKTAMRYLDLHQKEIASLPADSIQKYGTAVLKKYIFSLQYDALESMRMSGLFYKLRDQRVSLKISKAYSAMNMMEEMYHSYHERKSSYLSTLSVIPEVRELPIFVEPANLELYFKYPVMRYYVRELPRYQPSKTYRTYIAAIKEAVQAVEEYLER